MTHDRNPNAWNNWYHAVGGTYGTWLRGDPRGFRTFHHRQHVDGDYKQPPPPGAFASVFEDSKAKLRYPPVKLTGLQRRVLRDAMIERLHQDEVEVIALAVAFNHFHLLARFPVITAQDRSKLSKSILQDGRDPAPRHYLGRARKHASHVLLDRGLKPESPVWAVRPKLDPVRDRTHQVNLAQYIVHHRVQDAAVFYIGDS